MKLYVARNKSNSLYLYKGLPGRNKEEEMFFPNNNTGEFLKLDNNLFPDVKWENEPQEVVLLKVL